MATLNRIHVLVFLCFALAPVVAGDVKYWYYIHIMLTNYHLTDPCFCMAYTAIPDSYTCVHADFIPKLCHGQSLDQIFGILNEALNQTEYQEIRVGELKITIDIGEVLDTVVFDQKSVLPHFQFDKVVVTHHIYENPYSCPPGKGNDETIGVLSFIDWISYTQISNQKYKNCRNGEESIITLRNCTNVTIKGIEFDDNEQSPILIIDSNVDIRECTIQNTRQYYNKTLKKSIGKLNEDQIAFSLGITVIMTDRTPTDRVTLNEVIFKNNRCQKINHTETHCVHNVDKNAIPTSFFGGAVGMAFTSSTGSMLINNSVFINNTACDSGGAVFIHVCDGMANGSIVIQNSTINNNTAGYLGGGVYLMQEIEAHNFYLEIIDSHIESNQGCIAGGGIAALIADQSHNFNLIDHSTNLTTERVSFSYLVRTKFIRNYSGKISSGHAAYLKAYNSPAKKQHPVIIFVECDFSFNHKINSTPNGLTFGSILAENFILGFAESNNISNSEAGGLLLIQSLVIIYGKMNFNNLSAYSGGAIHARKWSKILLTDSANILFNNNSASIAGGAIFHYFGNWDGYSASSIYNSYCLLGYFPSIRTPPNEWKSQLKFVNNDAGAGGGAVFVTDLRQCSLYEGRIELGKAFNYTNNFIYINNTVSQGKLTYLGRYYGTIASSVEKLRMIEEGTSHEQGPGIEIPINYEPLDQLDQATIAVVRFESPTPSITLDQSYYVLTPSNINRYLKCKDEKCKDLKCKDEKCKDEKCKDEKSGECLLNNMPHFLYNVSGTDSIPENVTFNYQIKSGIESINAENSYNQNNLLTINNPYCDIGYSLSPLGICTCNYNKEVNGVVRCTSTGSVYIESGYWGITRQDRNSNFSLSSVIVKCAHSTCACDPDNSHHGTSCTIPKDPNELCVAELNREGDLCGNCKENYTFLPFSVECVPAPESNNYALMAVYIILTFVCACLILIFRCKFWNGFRIFLLLLYSLTYINYSFNLIQHIWQLRSIQILQGFSVLNFYLISPAFKDVDFTKTEMLALYPVVTISVVLIIFAILSAVSYRFPSSTFHHKFKIRRLISPALFLWYIMCISLFRVFLDFAYCIQIPNYTHNLEFRNRYSGTTECYTTENGYTYFMTFVFFLVLICVLPVPVLLILGSLKWSTNRFYTLNKLILPFKSYGRFHWGWEFIRFLLLAIGLVAHDTEPKVGSSILAMSIVFLMIVHISVWPYKERSANIIECIGWILLSLMFIIDNGVTLNYSYLDVFQLILVSLILVLMLCAIIIYVILKIGAKLDNYKFRAKVMKIFPKNMPFVRGVSAKIYKQLSARDEGEELEEPRIVEKPKQSSSQPLHRRDSILTKLSLAVNTNTN